MICINFVQKPRPVIDGYVEKFRDARKAIGRFDNTTQQKVGRMLGERHWRSATAARRAGGGMCAALTAPRPSMV